MSSKPSTLIPDPCHEVTWDEMTGDDRKKLCQVCSRHVHNISELERAEADALFANTSPEERLCIHYMEGADGEVFYRDSTNPIWRLHRQVQGSKRLLAAALALPLLTFAACDEKSAEPESAEAQPVLKIDQGVQIDVAPGGAAEVAPPSPRLGAPDHVIGKWKMPESDAQPDTLEPEPKIGKVALPPKMPWVEVRSPRRQTRSNLLTIPSEPCTPMTQQSTQCMENLGWKTRYDDLGRLRYAYYTGPQAPHDCPQFEYDEIFYGVDERRVEISLSELFSEARSLLAGEPSREAFLELCEYVEWAMLAEPEQARQKFLPYVTECLTSWPDRLKCAPLLWINKLITHALPLDVLQVVSALLLTPALARVYSLNPKYPLLLHWLCSLPEDVPALKGVSLASNPRIAARMNERLQSKGALPKFLPDRPADMPWGPMGFDASHPHYRAEDLLRWLESPLMRELQVLDLSWGITERPQNPRRRPTDARGLPPYQGVSVLEVFEHLCSSDLVHLDVQGQFLEEFVLDEMTAEEFSSFVMPLSSTSSRIVPPTELYPSLESLHLGHGYVEPGMLDVLQRFPRLRVLSWMPDIEPEHWEALVRRVSFMSSLEQVWCKPTSYMKLVKGLEVHRLDGVSVRPGSWETCFDE